MGQYILLIVLCFIVIKSYNVSGANDDDTVIKTVKENGG